MFYAVHGENSHNCSWNFTNNRRARKQKAQSKQKSEKEMKTKSTERGVQMSFGTRLVKYPVLSCQDSEDCT